LCRGCGDAACHHEKVDLEAAKAENAATAEKEKEEAAKPKLPPLPPEAEHWDGLSRSLFLDTGGKWLPDRKAELRRPPPERPEGQEGEGAEPAGAAPGGPARGCRVSVVCPTMESRQQFHDQLWATFNKQTWPEKELVVVETYVKAPSPFLTSKAREDTRIVYVSLPVDSKKTDLSIGLKRNMCTFLASGIVLASFDDDDLYAPSYVTTMVESLIEEKADGITLSSWYVFDSGCGKFGYVDPVKAKEMNMENAPGKVDEWLFGYGFSYVFTREAAVAFPYRNQNLGEDYNFFRELRRPRREAHLQRRVALLKDEFGLCMHTLHSGSTSNNWAQEEVSGEEVQDLDVAELGDLLPSYFKRFPRTGNASDFIQKTVKKRERKMKIHTSAGEFEVEGKAGLHSREVLELLAVEIGSAARDAVLHRWIQAAGEWQRLAPEERAGLRTTVFGAVLPHELPHMQDKQAPVHIIVHDVPDTTIQVEVVLEHPFVRVEEVHSALLTQHRRGPKSDAAAARVRLAILVRSGHYAAVIPRSWLHDRRQFWAPHLAEFLGRKRSDDD